MSGLADDYQVFGPGHRAALRLARKLRTEDVSLMSHLLHPSRPSGYSDGRPWRFLEMAGIWVTDDSDIFRNADFQDPDRLFTVTSTLVFENMSSNRKNLLVSPMELARHGTPTHRGAGLQVFTSLMRLFGYGVELGNKDSFLWLASQVDAEQVHIEDKIARHSPDVDKRIREMFIGPELEYGRLDPVGPAMSSKLRAVCEVLLASQIDEEPPYALKDPTIKGYVSEMLDVLYECMGIRGSWYNRFDELWGGFLEPRFKVGTTMKQLEKEFAANLQLTVPVTATSQAVILEIDRHKLVNATPVIPFHLGRRSPSAMMPASSVPTSCLATIYVEDPATFRLPVGVNVAVKRFSDLPEERWMSYREGADRGPATVESVRELAAAGHLQRDEPLCTLRYVNQPDVQQLWARLMAQEKIAPLWINAWDGAWHRRPAAPAFEAQEDDEAAQPSIASASMRLLLDQIVAGSHAELPNRVMYPSLHTTLPWWNAGLEFDASALATGVPLRVGQEAMGIE